MLFLGIDKILLIKKQKWFAHLDVLDDIDVLLGLVIFVQRLLVNDLMKVLLLLLFHLRRDSIVQFIIDVQVLCVYD